LFNAVQRQVIDVFADQHPGDQARRRHAAINYRRWKAAATMRSHGRQAYCGRMCRRTKNVAGVTSSCSLMSSPIFTSAPPRFPPAAFHATINPYRHSPQYRVCAFAHT
jgi:hypothetical protein